MRLLLPSSACYFSSSFALVWNIACGAARNKGELIAFRFLAGLGGSAPLAVGGGVLGDCWRPEERGRAIALYSLAPLLGPVLGPVAGAWIAQRTTWRWVVRRSNSLQLIVYVHADRSTTLISSGQRL